MYIDVVPNRHSRPAVLLREGWREHGQIKKRTVANLSHWPKEKIAALRLLLQGEKLVPAAAHLQVERSLPHGHVAAILGTMRKLGLPPLLAAKRCRERDLVLALIAERLLQPASKLATTRFWHSSTLAEELAVADADEDELYQALDWLLARQEKIEQKLAARHLAEGGLALYDVTSSYYEGRTCPLARFGYGRDKKRGRPVIVYGALANSEGLPVALQVYPGHTGDPSTVADQVEKLQGRFGLKRVVLVGDRGLLTKTQLENLRRRPGLGWLSAMRSAEIRQLLEGGALQLSLFDERNLAEISSPQFPGERLIACRNPFLAEERKRKREELLAATEKELGRIAKEVARRKKKLLTAAAIGKKVGAVIGRYKMAKHFRLEMGEGRFTFTRHEEAIQRESELDGIYVVRTSEPRESLPAADVVRSYKSLAQVERVFRTLKGLEIRVRPIFHHEERRVRAHIFLCLLAYYVEWHLRQALKELLFDDEELAADRRRRDPVAPAQPSASAVAKKQTRRTRGELPVHSFGSLLAELGTLCRLRCRFGSEKEAPSLTRLTTPTPLQQRAFDLLGVFP